MKALVTGVAGFIGSTLAERLVRSGADVIGIDCFTDYYPRAMKERNLTAIAPHSGTATSDKPGTNRATIRTRTPQRPKKRSVFLTHVSRDSDSLQTV